MRIFVQVHLASVPNPIYSYEDLLHYLGQQAPHTILPLASSSAQTKTSSPSSRTSRGTGGGWEQGRWLVRTSIKFSAGVVLTNTLVRLSTFLCVSVHSSTILYVPAQYILVHPIGMCIVHCVWVHKWLIIPPFVLCNLGELLVAMEHLNLWQEVIEGSSLWAPFLVSLIVFLIFSF